MNEIDSSHIDYLRIMSPVIELHHWAETLSNMKYEQVIPGLSIKMSAIKCYAHTDILLH